MDLSILSKILDKSPDTVSKKEGLAIKYSIVKFIRKEFPILSIKNCFEVPVVVSI